MLNNMNLGDLPEELRQELKNLSDMNMAALKKVADYMASKVEREEGIEEYELENSLGPISQIAMGYKPAVVPFEVRGGPDDGKRLVTLCVQLADGKTVMPVLQVPDFHVLESAEYVGSKDDLEILLPEDGIGIGWQRVISDTVEEYGKLHGGG